MGTIGYRKAQFKRLDLSDCIYNPSLKLWDSKGVSTNVLNLTQKELLAVIKLLTKGQ